MTEVMDAPVIDAPGMDGRVMDGGAASAEAWEWVRAAQAGDREAFGRLYARYQPGVLRFVRWRVGDPGLAEDLTSEAFVRALRRLETLRERRADPGAWLTTIARNLVADHRKSPRTRFDEVVAEVPEARAEMDRPEVEAVAGARADREVAARLVADCLERLTPAQRRVIELYQQAPEFGAGPAVAEAMGRSHGAVKTLKSTALSRMREHLAEQGLFSSDDCYHTGFARPRQRPDHTSGPDDGAEDGAGDGAAVPGPGRFEAHLAHSRRVLAELAAGRQDQDAPGAHRHNHSSDGIERGHGPAEAAERVSVGGGERSW